VSFGVLALLASVSASAGETALRGLERESRPEFVLSGLAGERIDLSQRRGQIVLVHFFATWCEPCREELPALRRLAERFAGVSVIAISVGEPELRVRRFAETAGTNFPILLDGDQAVARSWQVVNLPTTYLLDRDLNPAFVAESGVAWDALDLAEFLEQLTRRDVR
jgi:peroxiredoxin